MKFRTEVQSGIFKEKLDYQDVFLLMGSCFSQNIGEKLFERKFSISINPFGIVFNPFSLISQLDQLIGNVLLPEQDVFFHNELWHSFHHHSSFDSESKEKILNQANVNIQTNHKILKTAKVLFITFGSSFYYQHKETHRIVSNCHKLPQLQFTKVLGDRIGFETQLIPLIEKLKHFNTELQIVFTVSPVRHAKDGLIENSRSKGILLDLCHSMVERFTHCHYFPAYEFLIDDLRDYRFYASDMLHPNSQAIEYVWLKFVETFFATETEKVMRNVEEIVQAASHRPMQIKSDAHQQFIRKQLQKIEELLENRNFDFETEKTQYLSQLRE